MKNYFLRLLAYDQHTNLLLLDELFKTGQPPKAVHLMAHMLAAQQIWLKRCKRLPTQSVSIWPDWEAVRFKYLIEENYLAWVDFIESLTDEDFEQELNYQTSKGDNFQNKLVDILAHLINHGTHHRAQIGQLLQQAGLEQLPITDYVFYLRHAKQ